ncbi:MAG: aminopeptidase P N-terminal domain-containing protein [Clostridia bacterium]|nr:aminopeptidase P N-terminal domain-containing protein [Clostridia bacterium]
MQQYIARREALLEKLLPGGMAVIYSGETEPCSLDEGFPFEANHHFFYLTGIRRENMALALVRPAGEGLPGHTVLFIEEPQPLAERWTGRRMTIEEAKAVSGVEDVRYIDQLDAFVGRCITREVITAAYFDCYKNAVGDPDSYNLRRAKAFAAAYPAVALRDVHPLVAGLRMVKDETEIAALREAVALTDAGLRRVLATLKPGQMEYQAQAEFEYAIRMGGADGVSFATIAGSGLNGCMMHYGTNHCRMEDGSLVLLDLGAKAKGYCADITRTYPVGGKYSERQRRIYDLVLSANRAVAAAARPGLTLRELNDLCKQVLGEGLVKLGMIADVSEVGKYYMHSVSHHLGIDTHDAIVHDQVKLEPGMVITDEPGLYIDEEAIGIRIEDDLLITADGCEVLSEAIPRTTAEIEALMAR